MTQPFSLRVTVYYEDTDAGGVVYYANYLKFFERARTEWLIAAGINQTQLMKTEHLVFAVVSANVQFVRPARLEDRLQVTAEPVRRSRTSLTFNQVVRLETLDNAIMCEGEIRVACLDADSFRPRALPEPVCNLVHV